LRLYTNADTLQLAQLSDPHANTLQLAQLSNPHADAL
jgi:hypothetical protein